MRFFICILLYGLTLIYPAAKCFAQQNRLKVLQDKLKNARHDTDRVNIYYSISRYYWGVNSDSGLMAAQQSLNLAKQIHFEKGIALAYLSIGVAMQTKQELPVALNNYFLSLRLSQKLGLDGLSANLYTNIGNVYLDMGDHYTEALDYYNQAYKIFQRLNDPTGFSMYGILVNMGEVLKYIGKPDSAIAYNSRALAIAERVNDSASIATAQFNIGENFITLKQYNFAKYFIYSALHLAEKINDIGDIAYSHNALALLYYYTGQTDSARYFGAKGLQEGRDAGFTELMQKGYHVLYLVNKQQGSYKEALHFYELETTLNDSLKTAEKVKVVKNIQALYDLEKQQQQVTLLSKDNALKQSALRRADTRRNILIGCAVILLVIAILLFNSYTQKRKLNARLQQQNENIVQQNERLEKMIDTKNRMFSIIGHDLRGPVNSINSMLGLLKTNQVPQSQIPFVIEKTSESLSATAHFLDNLLFWAKSQMETVEPNPVFFDIQGIITEIINLLTQRAEEKKINLLQTGDKDYLEIYADKTMIEIVIRNLTENALKFSRAGDTVTISVTRQSNNVLVSVTDTGVGIPAEAKSKVLDKSSLYTTFGTKKEKGSGLGLLLCQELVELHKGSLNFESTPGKGSKFYFTLPQATLK